MQYRMNNPLCCRLALIALLPVIAALTAAPTASAVVKRLPDGKTLSYLPTPAKMKALRASGTVAAAGSASQAAAPQLTGPIRSDSAFTNVDYNGGPVMPSNTNYLIFWAPNGAVAYPSNYQSGLDQYLTDLAADSGGHANVDSVAAQYNDSGGNFGSYQVKNGGSFNDPHSYPASGCGAGAVPSGTICLTDAQIQAELQRFASANSLPTDLTHEYFLLLPPNVVTCFDSDPTDGCDGNANAGFRAYCAYHGNGPYTPGNPNVLIYANDPYVVNNPGCDDGNHPNLEPSDGAIEGGLSHEHIESVTDPIPGTGWVDFTTGQSTGFEVGDKCQIPTDQYGTPLGTHNGANYNQVINGHFYWQQEEWSNQGATCLANFTLNGTEPTATFTVSPGSGPDTVHVDSTGSTADTPGWYHWEFENPNAALPSEDEQPSSIPADDWSYPAGGTHTISLTVYRSDGTSIGISRDVTLPTVAFTNAAHPLAGHAASFDATGSTAGNGGIAVYDWDFGDGSPTAHGATPTHSYAAPGTYDVALTVTDHAGFQDQILQKVTVFSPPAASFSASTHSLVTGQAVRFDGSSSSSDGGSITSYSWNFGDGTTGTGATPAHAYAAPGNYVVRLTVTDNFGDRATSPPQTVVVDELPSAGFVVPTAHPATGAPVQFDGTPSRDPDGSIVSYSWNFGDGSGGSGASPTHIYASQGAYTVSLSIVDSSGLTASSSHTITVVRASKISKMSITKGPRGRFFLAVKVTGAGLVSFGKKHAKLRKGGTAKFQVRPNGRRKLRETVVFVPVAGSKIRKTATLTVPR